MFLIQVEVSGIATPGWKFGAVMKKFVGSVLSIAVAVTAFAAPAIAEPDVKTQLVDGSGKQVDSLLLRYAFDATWVLDDQKVLLRDTYLDHYLVTLAAPCEWMDRSTGFKFFPSLSNRVRASLRYEVRDNAHENCDIAKLEKISTDAAKTLRAENAKD
jgi:hypothetical protein